MSAIIQSGQFTKELTDDFNNGSQKLNQLRKEGETHPIEATGQKLRALMPWVAKRKLGRTQADYSS